MSARAQAGATTQSWNNSTTAIQFIRDRLYEQGWHNAPTAVLPVIGPALALEPRPLDLGIGQWR